MIHYIKITIYKTCILAFIIILISPLQTTLYGQNGPEISLTKHSEITGDRKHFLGSPDDLLVTDDHVFIADLMDLKIKVFSKNGDFQREMGGRGRGPGEFQDLTAIWLDQEGNIHVADYQNAKVIGFDSSGEIIEEKNLGNGKISWPRTFHKINDEEYLVMYKSQESGSANELFHLWNADFDEHKTSFALPPNINSDEVKNEFMNIHVGSSLIKGSTLFYAPFIYEGEIYSRHLEDDQGWESYKGKSLSTEPYEELQNNENIENTDGENIYDYRLNSPNGTFVVRLYSSSKALFATEDGYLAHFIEIRDGDQKQQGIELYDQEGTLLGYEPYTSEEIRDDRYTLIREHPKAMDKENRVYTIDRYGDEPVINVYELEISE